MSHGNWRRHADEGLAVDDLLDAAGRAFADLGVGKATMIDIARYAGCARATLYRYFPNREAVHLGFVHRATLRIASELADRPGDDRDSLADRVLSAIAAVRADPLLAVWFEPENVWVPMKVAQDSELLRAMSVGRIDRSDPNHRAPDDSELRAEWFLRSIVSLLATPGRDDATERAMVESFVVPLLIPEAAATSSHP